MPAFLLPWSSGTSGEAVFRGRMHTDECSIMQAGAAARLLACHTDAQRGRLYHAAACPLCAPSTSGGLNGRRPVRIIHHRVAPTPPLLLLICACTRPPRAAVPATTCRACLGRGATRGRWWATSWSACAPTSTACCSNGQMSTAASSGGPCDWRRCPGLRWAGLCMAARGCALGRLPLACCLRALLVPCNATSLCVLCDVM